MEQTATELRISRIIQTAQMDIDRRLPPWARRSNPLIRRYLGAGWKTILPGSSFLIRIFLAQALLVLLTVPFPFLFELALPATMAAVLLLPIGLALYGQTLSAIATATAGGMADDLEKDTFTLVRVTPFDLRAILASRVTAAIWRRIEDLSLLVIAVAALTVPLLIWMYAPLWRSAEFPLVVRAGMLLGMVVSLLRLGLEPFMVGALGVLLGAATRTRYLAVLLTLVLTACYFLLLNLPRIALLSSTLWARSPNPYLLLPLWMLVEFVLPVALPPIIIGLCLRLTRRIVEHS